MATSVSCKNSINKCCATPSTQSCLWRVPGNCSYYSGPNIAGPGINTGDVLNTVVTKLVNFIGGGGGGSVTSVGVSMPGVTAFNVANSPITSSGVITITAVGTTNQYIRGNGTLATFPTLASIIPVVSADFEPDGVTYVNPALNGTNFEIFYNDINRFIYNEIGNQEWDVVVGGGFTILIPGFDASTNNYHLYIMPRQ